MLIKQSNHDIDIRISQLLEAVNTLTLNIDKINTKHEFLSENQDELAKKINENAMSINKKVDKNSEEIRLLQTSTAKIDTVSNLARYGGIALVSAIVLSWNTLSTKVEVVTTKTDSNSQNITHLQKDMLDDQKQIDTLGAKVAENRENIITRLRTKQNRKGVNDE